MSGGLRLLASRSPAAAARRWRWLPFLHHDLIHLPLPGLSDYLVRIAEVEPERARRLIAEATDTVAQGKPARRALLELQTRALERGARERLFEATAALALPFLPEERELEPGSAFSRVVEAAKNLRAAGVSTSHHHREQTLVRAAGTLRRGVEAITEKRRPSPEERRMVPVLRAWQRVVEEEHRKLAREREEHPQVPTVFVAGSALAPEDRGLFKGRQDLARMIDHDLTADRRVPLLLTGQRRMGKSSLLNMLPVQLGTGTEVVVVNFQAMSSWTPAEREAPQDRIARELVPALERLPSPGGARFPKPPTAGAPWGDIFDWLQSVDGSLVRSDLRLLVALDEVERYQEEIANSGASTDLLDFTRAAGDSFRRIRFLLVSAYPLHRLGPHWVDRLISAVSRRIGPLDEEAARQLVTEPTPAFPDIYPAGGVERLLRETGCHPYLLQLVCDQLCRLLNAAGRLKATSGDLDEALDQALLTTPLFRELWRQRSDDERAALHAVARGGQPPEATGPALLALREEGYLVREGDAHTFATPLFGRWVAERGA